MSGGIALNLVASLPTVTSTAVASLLLAGLTSATIAFILPQGAASFVRLGMEWASVLSGVGYLAFALAFTGRISFVLGGVAIVLSYLPLSVLLLLHALEPHWTELVAGRALGLSVWQIGVATIAKARVTLRAAVGLYASRLLADLVALSAISEARGSIAWALCLLPISILCFRRSLAVFVTGTGRPIYPPLFGPLPELPPRLRVTPRLAIPAYLTLYTTVLVVAAAAVLEFGGLAVLHSWAAGTLSGLSQPPIQTDAVRAAIGDALPILAGAGSLVLLWRRSRGRIRCRAFSSLAVSAAALSPILLAYPAVAIFEAEQPIWLFFAIAGLAVYIALQDIAARWAHSLAARRVLKPGQATAAAAAGALGLPTMEPYGRVFFLSQALSSAAAWFASAAFLVALNCPRQSLSAAPALVWAVMAGAAQASALALRSTEPRPQLREGAQPTTLEDLWNEIT